MDAIDDMNGIEMIKAERVRQQTVEGWTPEHDDEHDSEELIGAAICYALNKTDEDCHNGRVITKREYVAGYFGGYRLRRSAPPLWPWAKEWDKREKHDRIKSLTIAGALIAAELDRLKRKRR